MNYKNINYHKIIDSNENIVSRVVIYDITNHNFEQRMSVYIEKQNKFYIYSKYYY